MDTIHIKNAGYACHIGITEEERLDRQLVLVDVAAEYETSKAIKTDSIGDAIDYSSINKCIKELTRRKEYKLVEVLADDIANALLKQFNILSVTISVKKPYALKNAEYAGIEISRKRE